MSSEISNNKMSSISKPTESKWLMISNLPDTATEEIIKECFERHGRVQSVKINDQRFAFVAFFDIRTASKAYHAENILDKQQLRTEFWNGLNITPKLLLESSPVTSSIVEPFSSSPSSITTVTNTLMDKTITTIHEDRDKRISHDPYSPEENTRHQVVPIKHDSNSSGNKRKTSSTNNSKTTIMKSSRRKHNSSSSSSERSHDNSLSHKHRRQHPSKLKRQSPNLKTKILKIYHLSSKMSAQSLRETLRNIFTDFKKSSHLLNIKIIDDYALLTFEKSEDVDKALLFILTKSIHGIRLKAEPYDDLLIENNEYNSICSTFNSDEYSVKATRTLYIGNLQPEISYHDLREIYSVYGEIIEIEIKRQQTQHTQIFAFIQYADIKSVVKALKSKVIHHHSIKLGFGKSQPTNVLWLDNLPSNITEPILRSFLNHITNLSPDEILDIYIDNRNCQIVQCLIYFTDIIAAQKAIHSIRGKKLETKRIQVDYASRIFLTKFSDLIQQTNHKKINEQLTNRSYQTERRYSKISDTASSVTLNRNPTRHHSSSSSSSSNHKKLIKSDPNTERIFDWLMQSHHSNDNEENGEEQISNLKIPETKKDSNQICMQSKNVFQTKIIPLQSDSLFIQSDIRLKVYSTLYKQSINSIRLPLPQFAKNLIKLSTNSIILNPKAHLKHLSFEVKNNSNKQQSISTNTNNEDLLMHNEFDERIRLLDKQIKQNQNIQIARNIPQISPITLSQPADSLHTTAMKYNPMSSITTLHPSIPLSLISPALSTSQLSPPVSNDKSIINHSLLSFDTNNNSSNILSTKFPDRLCPSIKFKRKPIPPPLSVITTLPIPSSTNNSPLFPTPDSMTPSSAKGNQNHSPVLTFSPISQQQKPNSSSKPTVLKSILKQSSNLSQSISNETRKAVHIISTDSSSELIIKRTLSTDNKNNHQTTTKKSSNQSINSKPIGLTIKPSKIVKGTPLSTKVAQPLSKNPQQLNQKSANQLTKTPKTNIRRDQIKKKSSLLKPTQQNKILSSKTKILKRKQQDSLNKPSVTNSAHPNQIPKKSTNEISKKKFQLKQNTCMYDRIKKRLRNEKITKSLLSTKDDLPSNKNKDDNIQQSNLVIDSFESEDNKSMKKTVICNSDISDTKEKDNKKINQQQIITTKFNKREFILKKKLMITKEKSLAQKRPSIDQSNESSKKIKLHSKINEEQTIKSENTISSKVEITSINHNDQQVIPMNCKQEPMLENDEMIKPDNLIDSSHCEQIKPILSTHKTQEDCFNKQQLPNEKDQQSNQSFSQILTDKPTSPSTIDQPSEKTFNIDTHFSVINTNPSNVSIDHQTIVTDKSIPITLPDVTKSSSSLSSTTNDTLNLFDSRPITNRKHSITSMHVFPQILTPDSNPFTPHHQHFPYPLFAPPPPGETNPSTKKTSCLNQHILDSPPLSTRTLSTSSCSSIIGNPLYNTIISGQQYYYDRESRRDSIAKLSTTSSSNRSSSGNIINQHQYLESDSISPFRNPSELDSYPTTAQQMLNSFATEFYRMNDIQPCDPYDIQWEGYVILKTDQAYIKTQLVAGNSQIARITINYWNSDLNHNLRISQRMRLEEIQLDGVQKRMQMDNDHCILIAEPNGLTPDELRLEQNHLKNGVIQYLNEKKAAGIINILLPGVLQPVYVVHIFPPCQFASEILQKHAPDAYRCVVQNKTEQIYLLFIITSTIQ